MNYEMIVGGVQSETGFTVFVERHFDDFAMYVHANPPAAKAHAGRKCRATAQDYSQAQPS